jgi:hypothetical protein
VADLFALSMPATDMLDVAILTRDLERRFQVIEIVSGLRAVDIVKRRSLGAWIGSSHMSRLTHFRSSSWQACRNAMSACSCSASASSGRIRLQSRKPPRADLTRDLKARAKGKFVMGSAPRSRNIRMTSRSHDPTTSANDTLPTFAPH